VEIKIQVNEEGIKEVGLEELVIAARWVSKDSPQVFFGEIGEKKVLFVFFWILDSRIFKGRHLIYVTVTETLFSFVESFKKFLVYDPTKRKVEYRDNVESTLPICISIPVIKAFTLRERRILEAIAKHLAFQR